MLILCPECGTKNHILEPQDPSLDYKCGSCNENLASAVLQAKAKVHLKCPKCNRPLALLNPEIDKKYRCGGCHNLIDGEKLAKMKSAAIDAETNRVEEAVLQAKANASIKCPSCKRKMGVVLDVKPDVVYNCPNCNAIIDGTRLIQMSTAAMGAELNWSTDQVAAELTARGVSSEEASKIAKRAVGSTARRNAIIGMVVGLVMICIGGGITGATYAAAESGGGIYFVFWGLIVVGAIAFLRGCISLIRSYWTTRG